MVRLWIATTNKGRKHIWRAAESDARERCSAHGLTVKSIRPGTERDYPALA